MNSAVIIVNYNNGNKVLTLVDKIRFFSGIQAICIIDNCSANDDYILLKNKFSMVSNVLVYKSDFNGGYSYGNNYGIRIINKLYSKIDLLYICNPDIIFEENVFEKINKLFDSNLSLYACSCLRTDCEGEFSQKQTWNIPNIQEELLSHFAIYRRMKSKKSLMNFDNNSDILINVDLLPGSFFAIRNSFVKEFGYLDENVFLYYEENILFKKLRDKNKQVSLITNCSYIHNHIIPSKTKYKDEIRMYKIYQNSKKYYMNAYLTKNAFVKFLSIILSAYDVLIKRFTILGKIIFGSGNVDKKLK